MPSSLASRTGVKLKSILPTPSGWRGTEYTVAPDFIIGPINLAAASFSGANSGVRAFVAPAPCRFLDIVHTHTTAGTNNYRVKKNLAANVSAPGAAADANNITISGNVNLAGTANVAQRVDALTTGVANLATGDKVDLASSAGTASLAGGVAWLRFAWL